MRAWFAQHRHALAVARDKLVRAPLATLLNVIVIGMALSLPLGLHVAVENLQGLARNTAAEPQLSVFLALEAGRSDIAQIETRLKRDARVRDVRFLPRDQALRELKSRAGLADVIDSLPQNPLPDAFVVDASDSSAAALNSLRDEIKLWPKVAHVQLDSAWAQRLDAALRLARMLATLLGALLGLALVAVTFNTIRLQILTQRDEIEVATLIGATAGFIRRPFLYLGAFQGCAGGMAAWAVTSAGVYLLNRNLVELSELYAASFRVGYLGPDESLTLLLVATVLGWLGAWLSVGRHLAQVQSRSSN